MSKKQHSIVFVSQLYAFLTVLIWSTAYVFTKPALTYFSVEALGFIRCAVGALCLGCMLFFKRKPLPALSSFPLLFVSGASGFALYLITFNLGSTSLDPTTSCVIISTTPILSAILARISLGEKLSGKKWGAIFMAFSGILIMMLWDGSLTISAGIPWMFCAAMLLGFYNIVQRFLARHYLPLVITGWSFFTATLILAPFGPMAWQEMVAAPWHMFLLACYLGVFPSALAYFFWTKALSISPKTSAITNYMFLTPFLALLLEYFITGLLPQTSTFVGGGVILLSLGLFTREAKNTVKKTKD